MARNIIDVEDGGLVIVKDGGGNTIPVQILPDGNGGGVIIPSGGGVVTLSDPEDGGGSIGLEIPSVTGGGVVTPNNPPIVVPLPPSVTPPNITVPAIAAMGTNIRAFIQQNPYIVLGGVASIGYLVFFKK